MQKYTLSPEALKSKQKALDYLKNISTKQLCEVYEMSFTCGKPEDLMELARNFLITELSERNPKAMIEWSYCDDDEILDKPSVFFLKD